MVGKGDYQAMLDVALEEAKLSLAEGGISIGAALFDQTECCLGGGTIAVFKRTTHRYMEKRTRTAL